MSSSEAKTQQASKRKLRKQRERGSVSQAPNLSLYLAQALALGVVFASAPLTIAAFQMGLDNAFDVMSAPVQSVFVGVVEDSLVSFVTVAGPVFACVLISAVLTKLIYQGGFVFSIDPMIPKLDKISPAKGLQRMFGKRGWIELGVSLARVLLWGGVFYGVMIQFFYHFLGAVICGASCLVDTSLSAIQTLFFCICVLCLVFAVMEGLLQKSLFAEDQRMTKSEVKSEQKEQMGSKEVRRERKRFGKFLQDSAGSVGVDKAAFAIFHEDKVIGVLYHPDLEPIPKMCVKGRTAEQSRQLRAIMRENGCRETECAEFVAGMINLSPGEYIPVALHPALIDAMHRMFAR